MPFKHETKHLRLPPGLDRRRKLTEEQKAQIITSSLSQRKLAIAFGVSRRTIQFLKDPSKLLLNRQQREERGGWRQYYDKEQHASDVRNTRRYRQKNFGRLIVPTDEQRIADHNARHRSSGNPFDGCYDPNLPQSNERTDITK